MLISMKIPVVFVVVTLVVSLTEGQLVSKCELRDQLTDAKLNLSKKVQSHITNEDFVAKLVCHVEKGSGFNTRTVTQMSINRDGSSNDGSTWTLYGLFQLSDHLICSSGAESSSVNICEMDCADLIDDNINNDVACLEILKMKVLQGEHVDAIKRMAKHIFQEDCVPVIAAEYFKEC